MSSQNDLKKLRALDEERAALEKKQSEARERFAGKIGASFVKNLGDDDAALLADKIGKMSKTERANWIKRTLETDDQAAPSTDAQRPSNPPLDSAAVTGRTAPAS
ncbi:MAG: hypothetical protein AAGJ73_13310 [Pseudomonadota bacterium]